MSGTDRTDRVFYSIVWWAFLPWATTAVRPAAILWVGYSWGAAWLAVVVGYRVIAERECKAEEMEQLMDMERWR